MKLSPLLYNFMKETLTEKANELRKAWKEAEKNSQIAYETGVKYADAQRSLEFLEEAYQEYATF